MHQQTLSQSKRIVIKIGSLLLTDEVRGIANYQWMEAIAEDVAQLQAAGKEVIIVSSGAVALGRMRLGFDQAELKLEEKQAAAACGQIALIEAWQRAFAPHDIGVAQMLITARDTEIRRHYLNARTTINTLLAHNIVPIINENDTITTSGIRYGDNDRMAARIAAMLSGDLLLLLSDIDGLYTADPKQHADATFIARVDTLDERIFAMAGGTLDHRSTGGMRTKLMAAEIAVSAGCHMMIARGTIMHPVKALLDGGKSTLFAAHINAMSARKHWIANSVHVAGTLHIDAGAERALLQGNSLLPAGVIALEGEFKRGDTVAIYGPKGVEIAKGLVAYSMTAAQMIMGKKSKEIEAILGYKGRDELVHRDDMALTQ